MSGSGNAKTETVTALAGAGATVTSTITSEGALLSATSKRERSSNATGGLLRKLGNRGVLVVKDVTSILSMNRDMRAGVLAALREVYDGRWERNVGTDGGHLDVDWAARAGRRGHYRVRQCAWRHRRHGRPVRARAGRLEHRTLGCGTPSAAQRRQRDGHADGTRRRGRRTASRSRPRPCRSRRRRHAPSARGRRPRHPCPNRSRAGQPR